MVTPGEPGRLVGIAADRVRGAMEQRIPEPAQDLIRRHIFSVAQLEVLLHLRGVAGGTATPSEVGREHKIASEMASDLLADLARRGFLVQNGDGFEYRPNPALAKQVDALADAYNAYRVAVINLIFSKPAEGVQNFADAFRVRKEDEE